MFWRLSCVGRTSASGQHGGCCAILVEHAARTISWMQAGDERMAAVATEALRALGLPVVNILRTA
jgi:hypothetical protein